MSKFNTLHEDVYNELKKYLNKDLTSSNYPKYSLLTDCVYGTHYGEITDTPYVEANNAYNQYAINEYNSWSFKDNGSVTVTGTNFNRLDYLFASSFSAPNSADSYDVSPKQIEEALIKYVKTLDYVDTDQIYVYGQSYGGLVVMMAAPRHNEVKGIFLESTGLTEDGGILTNGSATKGVVEKYKAPEDWKSYMKEYKGDVILLHSQGDTTIATPAPQYTTSVYEERDEGRVKYYSYADGEHAWTAFTQEAQQASLEAMATYILTDEFLPWENVFPTEDEDKDGSDQIQG